MGSIERTKTTLQRKKYEKGQSLVELAFGIVMLFVLLAGIIDLGRAFFTYMALRDAAQEGALYGSVHPLDTDIAEIKARTMDAAQSTVQINASDVSVSYSDPSMKCEGHGITVTIDHEFSISMPFMGTIIGAQNVPLSASVTDTIILPICP